MAGFFDFKEMTQRVLNSFVSNYVQQKGAPSLAASTKKTTRKSKQELAEGIDMGIQVEPGVIPVIYGMVGMSNTQFDLGRQSSEYTSNARQSICIPVAEGPIVGLASPGYPGVRDLTNNTQFWWDLGDTPTHWQTILVNDAFVADPNGVITQTDIEFTMTRGGTLAGHDNKDWQRNKIGDTNPNVDAGTAETESTKYLNDLGDVEAGKGVDYVLYWNHTADRWEAKSFSDLLQNAFDTRNSTGDSSDGDDNTGTSDQPTGADAITKSEGIKYTQWNPPPHELCIVGADVGDTTTTLEYTDPPKLNAEVVSGKGAALQNLDCPTPYFSTVIDFKGVNECIDAIDVTTVFPEGIYREVTSTTHLNNEEGRMVLRDTTRPITNAGNLQCLEPNIEIVESGKGYTATVQTRDTGSVNIYAVFTTVVCGREFVLTEESYTVSGRHLGAWYHTKRFELDQMNAGRGAITEGDAAGTQQIGAIEDPADCNADEVEHYDFSHYTLKDYLEVYPNQILREANQIKCYVWMDNKNSSDEYTISTDTYLHEIEICEDMGVFNCDYHVAELNRAGYILQQPDHNWKWQNYKHDHWQRVNTTLPDGRCYADLTNGVFSATGGPDPLPLYDYFPAEGTTVGDVVFPPGESIPYARMRTDGKYEGDASKDQLVSPLPASGWEITYDNPAETLTLTLSVTSGVLDLQDPIVTGPRPASSITMSGTAATLVEHLNTMLTYQSQNSTGDVPITIEISDPVGNNSTTTQLIKSDECENEAPVFTIDICGNEGEIRVRTISGKYITNTISFSGTDTNEQVAIDVATSINDYASLPNWTASASGTTITVTGPEALGDSYNGVIPVNDPTSLFGTTELCATFTPITGGCGSPIKKAKDNPPITSSPNAPMIPEQAFDKTSLQSRYGEVAWFDLTYVPKQDESNTTLSEIGLMVVGKTNMEEPNNPNPGNNPSGTVYTFDEWKALNYTTQNTNWDSSGGFPHAGSAGVNGISSNAAWVFYEYLTNTTYGLGNDIVSKLTAEQKERLFKDIWCAAAWCYYTPTGDSNLWASNFDGIFYGAESKYEALQKIADKFHGKLVYINGNPRLLWDGKGSVDLGTDCDDYGIKKIVNQANSANISYSSGSLGNLYNVINVKYNSQLNYWRTLEVQFTNVRPEHSIAEIGRRETTIELTGCTIEQQALWYAAWVYETEVSNSDMVSYTAGWDHFDVEPGDLIYLTNTLNPANEVQGGRAWVDSNNNTVTLDRALTGTHNIVITNKLGELVETTVTDSVVDGVVDSDFVDGCVWSLYSGALQPTHKVIGIEESEDGVFGVTAQKYDPDKYTRIWANLI